MIGLIGGLGVGAAIHYYERLAKAHASAGRPLQLLMAHADIDTVAAFVRAGEKERLAEYLASLIARLAAGGATFAVIPAVTPHICQAELMARSPLPIVSMLDAARDGIRARGLRRVALFGTRYTIERRMFGALEGVVEVVQPRPDEVDAIHDIYFGLATTGRGGEPERGRLTAIARTLQQRDGVDAIVLAGTDLALIFNEENTPFPAVDCARVHLDAILRVLLANCK